MRSVFQPADCNVVLLPAVAVTVSRMAIDIIRFLISKREKNSAIENTRFGHPALAFSPIVIARRQQLEFLQFEHCLNNFFIDPPFI